MLIENNNLYKLQCYAMLYMLSWASHTALSSFYFFYILIAFGFSKRDYIFKTTKGKINVFFLRSSIFKNMLTVYDKLLPGLIY